MIPLNPIYKEVIMTYHWNVCVVVQEDNIANHNSRQSLSTTLSLAGCLLFLQHCHSSHRSESILENDGAHADALPTILIVIRHTQN